jgi:hypothetical protein
LFSIPPPQAIGPENPKAVDFSGVGKQLEEAVGPTMAKFQGINVDHNVNHQSLNVTGGDGIGQAIAEKVVGQVSNMVEQMVRNLIGRTEPNSTGKLSIG